MHLLLLALWNRATGLSGQLRALKLESLWHCRQYFYVGHTPVLSEGFGSLLQQLLPALTRLTSLEVGELSDATILEHAPPQLLELTSTGVDDQSSK